MDNLRLQLIRIMLFLLSSNAKLLISRGEAGGPLFYILLAITRVESLKFVDIADEKADVYTCVCV